MKEIKLTQGKSALIDDADFDWLNKLNWYAWRGGNHNTFYAVSRYGILMHREIMNCKKGDGKIIDHKDGNGLNCQKNNLRYSTHSQNMANKKNTKRPVTSKYLGVSLHKKKYWLMDISCMGVKVYSRIFKSEENAATAYNILAEKYHGEFANLNI